MNVGNKLSDKPSIRLWKDKLAGGTGDAMRQALTDEAMGIVHEKSPTAKKPQTKAMAKRAEARRAREKEAADAKAAMELKRAAGSAAAAKKQDDTKSGAKGQQDLLQRRLVDAIKMGLLKGIKIAVADGADVNLQMGENKWTALHYAATVNNKGSKGIVLNYLLQQGADKRAKNISGKTPYELHLEYCGSKNPVAAEMLDPNAS